MICEKALDLLCELEDGTIRPDDEAALLAHLSTCGSCRAEYTFRETLRAQMASLKAKPPADFSGNVMARIGKEAEKKKARKRWLGPVAALGAVAAMLALTVGTGLVKLPGRDAAPAQAVEEKAPAEGAPAAEAAGEDAAVYEAATGDFEPADVPEGGQTLTVGTLPGSVTADAYGYAGTEDADSENGVDVRIRVPNVLESGMLLPADEDFCLALSEREEAVVMAYSGLDADFPAQLSALAPELGALLDEAETYEEDGRIVISTSIDAVMAIQEWLLLTLPDQENEAPASNAQREDETPLLSEASASPMLERITAFDPEGACLTTVVTVNPLLEPIRWPSEWPSNFAALFRIEKNWALYYPDEDYVPLHYDPAFLVLIPSPAAD